MGDLKTRIDAKAGPAIVKYGTTGTLTRQAATTTYNPATRTVVNAAPESQSIRCTDPGRLDVERWADDVLARAQAQIFILQKHLSNPTWIPAKEQTLVLTGSTRRFRIVELAEISAQGVVVGWLLAVAYLDG